MQLPVQNQIPCAGSFGCQRIHVALNKHDDKLDRLEEICFMEKLITRKEAAEILGISIATLDAARTMVLFLMCNMCRMAVCTLPQRAFRSISQNAPTEQSQQKRTQLIVNLAELECEPVRILVEIIMV